MGPGTVITCVTAGIKFGPELLWALTFSTIATILMQEMTTRLGLTAGTGLGEGLRHLLKSRPWLFRLSLFLVVSAIGVGCAAYQVGNLLGAAAGLQVLVGGNNSAWVLVLALFSGAILYVSDVKRLSLLLGVAVLLMSVFFCFVAFSSGASLLAILRGATVPALPPGSILTAMALVGTTVVPYNLFLNASTVRDFYHDASAGSDETGARLRELRWRLIVVVGIGGLISAAILVTGWIITDAVGSTVTPAAIATALASKTGIFGKYFFGLGLLTAGFSSAITAPLAAAYAVSEISGTKLGNRDCRFRVVWMTVLATGAAFGAAGLRPVPAIIFAQATNGVLLPLLIFFLIILLSRSTLIPTLYRNRLPATLAGGAVLAVTLFLAWRTFVLLVSRN